MKSRFIKSLEKIQNEMILLSEEIYKSPELGFKEYKTNRKICNILDKYGVEYKNDIAITGIVATHDSNKKGAHIGLLCELDAVPTINHKFSNSSDQAAHTCGHYAQVGVMLGIFLAIKESNILEELGGKISFIATPAEEYCDFDYRNKLLEENKITYISGKQEMLNIGIFDEIDCILSCHSMPPESEYEAELNSSLNGFLGKRIVFKGKSAHAGANPSAGINALNSATLAMNAISMLRETFKEEDAIRVHYILNEGGTTVNSVPEEAKMDMYIRANTLDAILEVNKKIDRALRAGAMAIGCDLEIKDTGGYLPLIQDKNLNNVVEVNLKEFIKNDKILRNCHSYASGDIGDLSYLLPTIQVGVNGFKGNIHGHSFKTDNTELAYILPMKYLGFSAIDLLLENGKLSKEIKNNFNSKLSIKDYKSLLKNLNKVKIHNMED